MTLEPDADGDGFGDETQDGCPTEPATQGECQVQPDTAAPDTTITEGPKKKSKKKAAEFGFSSSEPGSTFECNLDDNFGFVPCTSPEDVKVGKGKHTFQVRATDAAGNTDPTPATQTWTVKKKKRK